MNITGKTVVYGLIAEHIEHTLSPLMQNHAIAKMGIDAVYVLFRVKPGYLEGAVRGMLSMGIRGLNVTVPYKRAVMQYMDSITDVAEAIGAVNTIINNNDELIGDNTDAYGFTLCITLGCGIDRFPGRVCVIGAGGAARGVVYACAIREEVDEIVVINRTLRKAEEIADELSLYTGTIITSKPAKEEVFREVIPSAGLVINTTSVGMEPNIDATPVPCPEVFHEGQVVCDIVYNPRVTRFLRDAEVHGAKTIGGLAMLAFQGARSLSLWTGMDAPADVMLDVLRKKFDK